MIVAPLRQTGRTNASTRKSPDGCLTPGRFSRVFHENGQQCEADAQKQTLPDRPASVRRQL